MTYKTDLQLAFSGKEIALRRIAISESNWFNDESTGRFSRERCVKYQKLLEQLEERRTVIKTRNAEFSGGVI